MPDWYLQLNDDIGLNAEGNPEPIHEVGVALAVPTMVEGDIVDVPQRVTVHPIPGTRTIKTDDPLIAAGLLSSGQYHEVDPPTQKDLKKERAAVQDAKEQAGTIDPEPEQEA